VRGMDLRVTGLQVHGFMSVLTTKFTKGLHEVHKGFKGCCFAWGVSFGRFYWKSEVCQWIAGEAWGNSQQPTGV